MTTPGGGPSGFDYTDDSVIARVAFDIPASAVTDISQITQVMGAMRTQLEAVARAQSDWLDYLQQVPQIAERANQAFRDQITLMERMSYLQSEIGQAGVGGGSGGGGYGGGGGFGGGGQAGGGGAAQYSTAAPTGYQPHWQSNEPGMGTGTNINAAMANMAKIGDGDRAIGEMAAGRGIAINPAILGTIGGAVAEAFGQGNGGIRGRSVSDQGDTAPSSGGAPRDSSNPANPATGGTPAGSPDPNQPNPGSTPLAQLLATLRAKIGDENIATAAGRIGDIASKLPGSLGTIGGKIGDLFGGGGAGGGGGGGAPGGGAAGPGGFRGLALGAAKQFGDLSTGGKVGLGLGGAAAAFNMTQNIGERITRLQALGSQEGGDFATGLKEDFNARFQALDPFINTDQARKAIAMPMMEGFQGGSRDELRDLLINNFKELGISMADSMKFEMANLQGVDLTDKNVKESRTSNEAFLNTLKEMAGDGGNTMSLEQRKQQALEFQTAMASMGIGQESAQRSAIGIQQGYGDSLALRNDMSRIGTQTMGSGTLMAMVGQKVGLTGILPDAMPDALAEMGIDQDEAMQMAYEEAAKMVSGLQPEPNRIAAFKGLLGDQGVELTYSQAKDLYRKVTGKKGDRPVAKANQRAVELGEKNKQTNWNPITGIKDTLAPLVGGLNPFSDQKLADVPGDMIDGFFGYHKPSENADRVNQSFVDAGRIPGEFSPAGQKPRALPQSVRDAPTHVSTTGQVTGEVRLVVDQQGRVSAPPVIALSGTQRAVNAGAGSATLNNPSPGENHGSSPFSGGG